MTTHEKDENQEDEARVQAIQKRLQAHGYRRTAARTAILKAIIASGAHCTANDLVGLVRKDAQQVGRMTVYRTLELLCELGVMRPVYQGSGAAHYVLLEDGHHHHLICGVCDRVQEFDECFLSALQERIGDQFNFQVQGHLLELYGVCEQCADSGSQ